MIIYNHNLFKLIDKTNFFWENYNRGDVSMYQDRISLSIQDILDKEFKVDARGYRLQEVDKFLDIIIKDYNEFDNIIRSYDRERKKLIAENNALKQEIHNLKSSISAIKTGEKEITNVDLIRRISQLEKIIFGKEKE